MFSPEPCPVHSGKDVDFYHAPVLCRTERVWHHVTCQPKPREKQAVVLGTHMGHLNNEARDRRRAKNARNRSRKNAGNAYHERGSQRSGR
jgi:hypothetical protein